MGTKHIQTSLYMINISIREQIFKGGINHNLIKYKIQMEYWSSEISNGGINCLIFNQFIILITVLYLYSLHMGEKKLDIVASIIFSTHYFYQTQNSFLKIPWFHTPASNFSQKGHDTIGDISKKKWQRKIIPHLVGVFYPIPCLVIRVL